MAICGVIIISSYTGSLSSILTVRQLSSTISGIDSLIASDSRIGYQTGSFAKNYLIREFGIAPSRLVPLDSPEKYATALSLGPNKGGVAAIVDEFPYAQVFLSTQCGYAIVGKQFARSGWGFAFPKKSEMAIDMSTAILTLSESGELQRIQDKWLSQSGCNSEQSEVESDQLSLKSFWGLFLISGIACSIALIAFFSRMIFQFIHHSRNDNAQEDSASVSRSLTFRSAKVLRSFASFIDENSEMKRKSSKRKRTEKPDNRGPGLSPGRSSTKSSSHVVYADVLNSPV